MNKLSLRIGLFDGKIVINITTFNINTQDLHYDLILGYILPSDTKFKVIQWKNLGIYRYKIFIS